MNMNYVFPSYVGYGNYPYAAYSDEGYTSYGENRSIQFPPFFPGGGSFTGGQTVPNIPGGPGLFPPFIPGGGTPSGPFFPGGVPGAGTGAIPAPGVPAQLAQGNLPS